VNGTGPAGAGLTETIRQDVERTVSGRGDALALHTLTSAERTAFDRALDSSSPLSALEEADEALRQRSGFELTELDLPALIAEGAGGERWLRRPYAPEACVIWTFGSAGSAKSLMWQSIAAELTREGIEVCYVSEENPRAVDVERMRRLQPDFARLRYFHQSGIDLADPAHFLELQLRSQGAALIVLDTLSATWSGDEQSNAEIAALDRERLRPLVRLTGATLVVVHHTGHPQAFVRRGGVNAGRGASAMGQKADVVLVFKEAGVNEFTIEVPKNRMWHGHREPSTRFRIVDEPEGGLAIEKVGEEASARMDDCAGAAVGIVREAEGPLSTKELQGVLRSRGFGTATIRAALQYLTLNGDSGVTCSPMRLIAKDGKARNAKAWSSAQPTLEGDQGVPTGTEGVPA
jgi:hypothetical protein